MPVRSNAANVSLSPLLRRIWPLDLIDIKNTVISEGRVTSTDYKHVSSRGTYIKLLTFCIEMLVKCSKIKWRKPSWFVSVFHALSHSREKHPLTSPRPYVLLPIRILSARLLQEGFPRNLVLGNFVKIYRENPHLVKITGQIYRPLYVTT